MELRLDFAPFNPPLFLCDLGSLLTKERNEKIMNTHGIYEYINRARFFDALLFFFFFGTDQKVLLISDSNGFRGNLLMGLYARVE